MATEMARRQAKLEQVRALLAKTKPGAGTTDAEAQAAAAKAAELMLRHSIEEHDIAAAASAEERGYTMVIGHKTVKLPWTDRWQKDLLSVVANNNYARTVYYGDTHYVEVFGSEANVALVEYLFEYLVRQAIAGTNRAWNAVKHDPTAYTTRGAYRSGYRQGFIVGVDYKLRQMNLGVVDDDSKRAIVSSMQAEVDRAMEKWLEGQDARDSKRSKVGDEDAWERGARDAMNMDINRPVGAGDPVERAMLNPGALALPSGK